jgi:hypothetical protein
MNAATASMIDETDLLSDTSSVSSSSSSWSIDKASTPREFIALVVKGPDAVRKFQKDYPLQMDKCHLAKRMERRRGQFGSTKPVDYLVTLERYTWQINAAEFEAFLTQFISAEDRASHWFFDVSNYDCYQYDAYTEEDDVANHMSDDEPVLVGLDEALLEGETEHAPLATWSIESPPLKSRSLADLVSGRSGSTQSSPGRVSLGKQIDAATLSKSNTSSPVRRAVMAADRELRALRGTDYVLQ